MSNVDDDLKDRRENAFKMLDLSSRGLELGPLDRPLASKDDFDVLYVDHADTQTIRRQFADHELVGHVHDIDIAWSGRLIDLLPSDRPIRWAIASHVIEHVPDISVWLAEIAEVIEPGGVLSLVVPDHRYCFDANRQPSRPSDVLAAAVERRTRPCASQLIDSAALTLQVDTGAIWRGRSEHADQPPDWQHGVDRAISATTSDEFIDLHCWTFTPATFIDALEAMACAGIMTEWSLLSIRDTQPETLEFQAKLDRLPAGFDQGNRRQRQRDSFAMARASLAAQATPVRLDDAKNQLVEVSALERRFIGRKRDVASWCRSFPGIGPLLHRRDQHASRSAPTTTEG